MPETSRKTAYTVGGAALFLVLFAGVLALPDIIRYLKIERM
jgi:hypothetical protein